MSNLLQDLRNLLSPMPAWQQWVLGLVLIFLVICALEFQPWQQVQNARANRRWRKQVRDFTPDPSAYSDVVPSQFLQAQYEQERRLSQPAELIRAKTHEFNARRAEESRRAIREDFERRRRAQLVVAVSMGLEVRR